MLTKLQNFLHGSIIGRFVCSFWLQLPIKDRQALLVKDAGLSLHMAEQLEFIMAEPDKMAINPVLVQWGGLRRSMLTLRFVSATKANTRLSETAVSTFKQLPPSDHGHEDESDDSKSSTPESSRRRLLRVATNSTGDAHISGETHDWKSLLYRTENLTRHWESLRQDHSSRQERQTTSAWGKSMPPIIPG